MHEHKIFAIEQITKKVQENLSEQYTLNWYVTDQLTVMEAPTEWVDKDTVITPEMERERAVFIEGQRALMDAAIAKVREELINAI